ncbi:MAG: GatB/YqeY domain-containing protein [Candidatus Omnitrophota bacterium]
MLEERIMNDYKQALKAKDTLKASALNFLRAEMINVAIAKKKQKLEDPDVLAVIKKQVKERQDSIEQFQKGGRADLADKESKELEILKSYLPPSLAKEQIQKLIEEAVSEVGAKDMKDMGRVMKEVTAKCAGAADGKIVSELVRERLSRPPEATG